MKRISYPFLCNVQELEQLQSLWLTKSQGLIMYILLFIQQQLSLVFQDTREGPMQMWIMVGHCAILSRMICYLVILSETGREESTIVFLHVDAIIYNTSCCCVSVCLRLYMCTVYGLWTLVLVSCNNTAVASAGLPRELRGPREKLSCATGAKNFQLIN